MKKKRILFLDHTAKMSGGERSLLLILGKIDKTRFKPILITLEEGPFAKEAQAMGIETARIRLPKVVLERKRTNLSIPFLFFSFLFSFPAIFQLIILIKRMGVDLIYTNSQKAHLIGLFAGILAGIPVVWHFRDILKEGYVKKIVKLFGVQSTRNIIAISKAVAEQFRISGRINRKIKVIYNGIDLEDFEKKQKGSKTNLRKEYELPEESRIIASIGQIARWKGQEYLVYAASELSKRFKNLYFFIIGKPLFLEQEYYKKMRKLVEDLGLEKCVFFTGYRWDIPGIMKDIDILLHTPIEPEPFGRVLIEAMAAGTPIVAFDNGAVKEIIRDDAGILVQPFNMKGLVNALSRLLQDRGLYCWIAEKMKDNVKERFDRPILIKKIEGIVSGNGL